MFKLLMLFGETPEAPQKSLENRSDLVEGGRTAQVRELGQIRL